MTTMMTLFLYLTAQSIADQHRRLAHCSRWPSSPVDVASSPPGRRMSAHASRSQGGGDRRLSVNARRLLPSVDDQSYHGLPALPPSRPGSPTPLSPRSRLIDCCRDSAFEIIAPLGAGLDAQKLSAKWGINVKTYSSGGAKTVAVYEASSVLPTA